MMVFDGTKQLRTPKLGTFRPDAVFAAGAKPGHAAPSVDAQCSFKKYEDAVADLPKLWNCFDIAFRFVGDEIARQLPRR